MACTLVEQVMLVGQDRKALGALVVPKPEPLAAWAREQGLPLPQDGAAADPALLKALTSRLNRRSAGAPWRPPR